MKKSNPTFIKKSAPTFIKKPDPTFVQKTGSDLCEKTGSDLCEKTGSNLRKIPDPSLEKQTGFRSYLYEDLFEVRDAKWKNKEKNRDVSALISSSYLIPIIDLMKDYLDIQYVQDQFS